MQSFAPISAFFVIFTLVASKPIETGADSYVISYQGDDLADPNAVGSPTDQYEFFLLPSCINTARTEDALDLI